MTRKCTFCLKIEMNEYETDILILYQFKDENVKYKNKQSRSRSMKEVDLKV